MTRVWIVNPFDNLPLEGYRPMRYWLMAEAFAAAGCEATLWTCDFSHFAKRRRVLRRDVPKPPFAVKMLSAAPYRRNVSLARLYSHWRLARTFIREANNQPPPDIIIASSPPLTLAAAARRHARAAGARFVIDVMDAWPETFERVAPRWLLAPLRRLARANYRGADLITVVAKRYGELVREYGADAPVERFYHGIGLHPAAELPPPPGASVRLVYAGSLGRSYDLATVLRALALLPAHYTLDIAGAGAGLPALTALAGELGLAGRVAFHGYLDEGTLARLLGEAHLGIVPLSDDSCVGVPYKLADYADASLAVASSLAGETAELLAHYRAGRTYRPGDPQSCAAAIAAIATDLAACRAGSRRLAEEQFDARKIYRDYSLLVLSDGARSRPSRDR